MIELTTPDTVANVVRAYSHDPVTLVALLKEISYKAMIPATKDAALAALSAHYAQKD